MLRLVKVIVGIALAVHICACTFWLVKILSNTDEEMVEFLLYVNAPVEDDISQHYMVSFYFISTVFTTIGFGDIFAENHYERIYSVLVMFIGSIIFGTLLAEVNEAVGQASRVAREKDNHVQQLLDFSRDNEIPLEIENEIINWATFEFEQGRHVRVQNEILASLPAQLHQKVLAHLHRGILSEIPLLAALSHPNTEDFMLALWAVMTTETFYPGTDVVDTTQPADKLVIVTSGNIMIEYHGSEDTHHTLMSQGSFIGENSLLGDTCWADMSGTPHKSVRFVAVSPLVCMVLTRAAFEAVLLREARELREEVEWFKLTRERNRNLPDDSSSSSDDEGKSRLYLGSWQRIVSTVLVKARKGHRENYFAQRLQVQAAMHGGFTGSLAADLRRAAENESGRAQGLHPLRARAYLIHLLAEFRCPARLALLLARRFAKLTVPLSCRPRKLRDA